MKLSPLKANELSAPLKVTVQKTGRLGFTAFTATRLKLSTETCVHFYMDEDDPLAPVVVFDNNPTDDAFRIHKSGDYFSLSTAALFERLEYDYKTESIMCDLKRIPEADEMVSGEAYRLVPRSKKMKKVSTMVVAN